MLRRAAHVDMRTATEVTVEQFTDVVQNTDIYFTQKGAKAMITNASDPPAIDKIMIRVIAKDGWNYGGKRYDIGAEFHIDKTNEAKLEPYIKAEIIEVMVPIRAVDEMERTKIISDTVCQTVDLMVKRNKNLFSSIQVHDNFQDSTEYQKTGDYVTFTEFLKDVYNLHSNQEKTEKITKWISQKEVPIFDEKGVKAATGLGETVDSEGGVLAPDIFARRLMSESLEKSVVRQRATFVPMETNTVKIPAVEDTSHASNVFGGVLAYWVDEGTAPTATKPKFMTVQLNLNKLIALTHVTSELLEDSIISLENTLPSMFSRALAFQEDDAFINGSGAGQPLGLRNCAAKVSVAKEGSQTADTIVTNNILKMWSRCRGKDNAVWIANHDTFPQLAIMTIAVGTDGGSVVGILREQNLQGISVQTMMGRPVIFTELAQTLGDADDIMLCDLSQYLVGGKSAGGATGMVSSIHLKFDQDETSFKIRNRVDGNCWWKAALTPKYSTITLSPIVGLAERA